MATFAVEYRYDERPAERDAVRPAHRAFLRSLLDEGSLVASGPWTDGEPGALLLVAAPDAEASLAILDADPFWQARLITGRTVRGWDPVLRAWP